MPETQKGSADRAQRKEMRVVVLLELYNHERLWLETTGGARRRVGVGVGCTVKKTS
jgi:hypothetical protein